MAHFKYNIVFSSLNVPGLYPPRAKLAIQKYLSQLSDNEQVNIFERVQVGAQEKLLQLKNKLACCHKALLHI